MLRLLILNILVWMHPVHVTLTSLNQAPGNDTLKVSFRMYYDDFQRDYKLYYPDFKPGSDNDTSLYPHEKLVKYFNERVNVSINNKLLTGYLSDVSINRYEILMNIYYLSAKKAKTFRIRNKVLTTIYSDQANMVYLNINKYEDALKLTVDHDEEVVELK